MKYVFISLSVMFALFAAVQFNDPDPFIWASVYLLVAAFSFLAYKNKYFLLPTLVLLVLCFVCAIILFPPSFSDWWQLEEEAKSLKMKMPGIEEARESMGLIICVIALFVIYINGRKINKTKRKGVPE